MALQLTEQLEAFPIINANRFILTAAYQLIIFLVKLNILHRPFVLFLKFRMKV